jgi:phosphotransferase system enzyme I (PtsP)
VLDVLRSIVEEVNALPDSHRALDVMVTRVREAMGVDVCSVYLVDERHGDYVLVASDGLRRDCVGRVRLARGTGLVGVVAAGADPLNLAEASLHSAFVHIAETGESPFNGFAGVPVVLSRRVLGVLIVQRRVREAFGENEVSFLVTLAAQLAGVIAQIEIDEYLSDADRGASAGFLLMRGSEGAPGIALGTAAVVYAPTGLRSIPDRPVQDRGVEQARFKQAVETELGEIEKTRAAMARLLSPTDLALFDAYTLILRSNSLIGDVYAHIDAGNWAPGALREVVISHARTFENMADPYLKGRAADILDLGERLLQRLSPETPEEREYPDRVVLVGEDISVSDIARVPSGQLVAMVSASGTAASHVAVLARGIGIPAVFGVANLPVARLDALEIAVDGYGGRVCISPSAALREEYQRLEREEQALSSELKSLRDLPALMLDGHSVGLQANVALLADVSAARHSGAEGIGLYRSEMHFAARDRFPGEQEQFALYRQVLQTFRNMPVSLRTLDIGGDKTLPYFPINENNPYLGWRGIRVSLDHPQIFLTQLRAMLRAGTDHDDYRILLPMVSNLDEMEEAMVLLNRARRELDRRGEPCGSPRLGLMVEVPAVVLQIEEYARRVDALSIGTNDLAQYLFATDRNNQRVAHLYDGLHPALLSTISQVVEGARKYARPVTVCGELAADPAAALLLVGLGVDNLSMSHSSINKVKWALRSFSFEHARDMARDALAMTGPASVRKMINEELERSGLGGLVRAGR